MYLIRFLVNFAVFRVILWISQLCSCSKYQKPCTYELRHFHFTNWRLKICIWRLYFSGWSPQGDLKIFLILSPVLAWRVMMMTMMMMMMTTTMIISLSVHMTTTQVLKTSVTVNNSPTQNYAHPKNHAPGHLLIILYPSNIKSDNRPYYSFWYPLMAKYVQDSYSVRYYVKNYLMLNNFPTVYNICC